MKRIEKAQQLISEFSSSILAIKIDPNFSGAVQSVLDCKGKIITTGMGKAGIAMRKFSSTLCSLGFPSCHIHPGEASHGDLGVISKEDILFVASTSGKTREILEIIDLARNINVKSIIGITSHPDSPLRQKADIIMDMGIVKESGHLGLAPTSSILVMLAITDALALVCAEEIGLTFSDYFKCHHGGYLGQVAKNQCNKEQR